MMDINKYREFLEINWYDIVQLRLGLASLIDDGKKLQDRLTAAESDVKSLDEIFSQLNHKYEALQVNYDKVISEFALYAMDKVNIIAEREQLRAQLDAAIGQEPHHYLLSGKTVAYPNEIYDYSVDPDTKPYYAAPIQEQAAPAESVTQNLSDQEVLKLAPIENISAFSDDEISGYCAGFRRCAQLFPGVVQKVEQVSGVDEKHIDDFAVDQFACFMKEKMKKSRQKGRGGWSQPLQCSGEHLAKLLIEHVKKGDLVDIANFAMMLCMRGIDKQVLIDLQPSPNKTGVPEWKPIETAPKSKLIDIWIRHKDGSGIRWCDCYYDHICDDWRTTGPSGHLVFVPARSVTHWTDSPLPPLKDE